MQSSSQSDKQDEDMQTIPYMTNCHKAQQKTCMQAGPNVRAAKGAVPKDFVLTTAASKRAACPKRSKEAGISVLLVVRSSACIYTTITFSRLSLHCRGCGHGGDGQKQQCHREHSGHSELAEDSSRYISMRPMSSLAYA
eukprot:2656887-Pleurochrysis_carterae.AAC.2